MWCREKACTRVYQNYFRSRLEMDARHVSLPLSDTDRMRTTSCELNQAQETRGHVSVYKHVIESAL
jgi:hypothetical protein